MKKKFYEFLRTLGDFKELKFHLDLSIIQM